MFCSSCGKELRDDAKFCDCCGAPVTSTSAFSKQSVIKEGKVYKCPYCGEALPFDTITCPTCGSEIRSRETSESIKKFSDKLETIRNQHEKAEYIRLYPIPNNREDIFEFMLIASTNCKEVVYHSDEKEISDAWINKTEQCYKKAIILFKDQNDIDQITKIYNESKKKNIVQKRNINRLLILGIILLVIGTILFVMAFIFESKVPRIYKTAAEGDASTTNWDWDVTNSNYPIFMFFAIASLLVFLPAGILLTVMGIIKKIKTHR